MIDFVVMTLIGLWGMLGSILLVLLNLVIRNEKLWSIGVYSLAITGTITLVGLLCGGTMAILTEFGIVCNF